jgi:putative tryptophan/tyrosine transport system substrate-binding protein
MQFNGLKRREVIVLLGGAAAWPAVSPAQPTNPLIGFLGARSATESAPLIDEFRQGLAESGYFEGSNVSVEYRWAEGRFDKLPGLAAELVRHQAAVIAATGGEPAALAATAATRAIPIVFAIGGDPIAAGLVPSLNRPGGNLTGVTLLLTGMEGKRLGLLREMVPTSRLVAVLLNPAMGTFESQSKDIQEAAHMVGLQTHALRVSTEAEIDAAFAMASEIRADAILVGTDSFMISRRDQMIGLASRYAIPVMYPAREYALAGGLMSYGVSIANAYRQVGNYSGRILKGEQPGDLPVQQPTRFEFVINLRAARALGIEVPPGLSARADEVIE